MVAGGALKERFTLFSMMLLILESNVMFSRLCNVDSAPFPYEQLHSFL